MTRQGTIARRLGWATLVAAVILLTAALAAYALLSESLPRRSGSAAIQGLSAPVNVELDSLAIPRIHAQSLIDAFRAEGYLHAQNRFFQMDLARRRAAGELAALLGPGGLRSDKRQRPYQFRQRAQLLLKRLPAQQRAWLEAYTQGVNAGLADLGGRPPEYLVLDEQPKPWKPEDSLLVLYGFYELLSNNQKYELPQGVMKATLPASVYRFLTPSTSRFDRPLLGVDPDDPTGGYVPEPIPSPADLRYSVSAPAKRPFVQHPLVVPPMTTPPASNQWAVAASRSASGQAMVANDPHLKLQLPNTFYRTELYWGNGHTARGLSMPGLPGIIAGATKQLAWGLTVSNADQSDWVVIEIAPGNPNRYKIPGGTAPFGTIHQHIKVHGGQSVMLDTKVTRWGPIIRYDWRGRPLALHATWLSPNGMNLNLLHLVTAGDVGEAVATVTHWSGPSLNWVFADSQGHIAWSVNGPLPKRVGFDGSRPVSLAKGTNSWQGRISPPHIIAPESGILFTANNRTLAEPEANRLSRMWMRPLRAKRISDMLSAQHRFSEHDLLEMQLDTRAEGFDAIQHIALEVLQPDETDPVLAQSRKSIANWNGHADVDQAGFRLLQVYYRVLLERVIAPLLARPLAADSSFVYRWPLADEVMRRLLEERPPEVLPAGFADWNTFLRAVLVDAIHALEKSPRRANASAPWGEVNRLDVAHPMADLPIIGHWLRLKPSPLPGSMVSVRVAAPDFGAPFRMVVAPNEPESGYIELLGGQSGHILSPHFTDQQAAWVKGAPAPFLAGPTVSSFELVPGHPQSGVEQNLDHASDKTSVPVQTSRSLAEGQDTGT